MGGGHRRRAVGLQPAPRSWTDYEPDVVVSNSVSLATYARFQDAGDNTSIWMRPWRHLDFSLATKLDNRQLDSRGGLARFSSIQTDRAILERLLRPYPTCWLPACYSSWRGRRPRNFTVPVLISLLVVATISTLAYLQLHYLQAIPHVPDSSIYLLQGKWFADGILVPPAPPVPQAFDIFGSYLSVRNNHWVSQYPFGHPLMLAVGWALGAVWLVNPVIAGLCIPRLYLLARGLYSVRPGRRRNRAHRKPTAGCWSRW